MTIAVIVPDCVEPRDPKIFCLPMPSFTFWSRWPPESGGGTVSIAFGPDGGADPAEVLLSDEGGHQLRILVGVFTGEVRVEEPEGA